jgi:hypothetical protein
MKNIVLFETYKSQKEIELLSKKILNKFAFYIDKTSVINTVDDIEYVYLGDIENDFSELNIFIKDNKNFPILFYDKKESVDILGIDTKGVYNTKEKYIILVENKNLISSLNLIKNDENSYMDKIMRYENILSNYYMSTIIHELQHAFDDWRSDGKYSSNKTYNKYFDDKKRHVVYKINLKI